MTTLIACDRDLALVPDGEYELCYQYHETWKYQGKYPKVVFWFKIVSIGEHFEKLLPRYFNVRRIIGKPSKNGRFVPGRSSDFLLEYCNLFPRRFSRLDRIPLSLLENELILATTRTVTTNREQRNLPDLLKYSVIDRWLRLVSR